MSAIGPGDAVVCVEQDTDYRALVVGNVYWCEEVHDMTLWGDCLECHSNCPRMAFKLHGIRAALPGMLPDLFCAARFRPYHGPEVEATELSLHHPTRTPAHAK